MKRSWLYVMTSAVTFRAERGGTVTAIPSETHKPKVVRAGLLCLVTLSAIGGAVTVALITTPYGIGLSPDSAAYIAGARSILGELSYLGRNGEPLTTFPPGFSMALALFAHAGLDLQTAARVLNTAVLFFTILLSGLWLERRVCHAAIAATGIIVVALARSTIYVLSFAWSDGLFILLTLMGLYLLDRYSALSSDRYLMLSALAIAGATVTRYAGISILPTAAIFLFITHRSGVGTRARAVVIFLAFASAPLAGWLVRNWIVAGNLTGFRPAAAVGVADALAEALGAIGSWFVPVRLFPPSVVGAAVLAATFACMSYIAVLALRSRPTNQRLLTMLLLSIFSLSYTVLMVYSRSAVALDPIDHRYMAPIAVPLLMLLILGLDEIRCRMAARPFSNSWTRRLLPVTVVASAILLLTALSVRSAKQSIARVNAAPVYGAGGYGSPTYQESHALAWLRANPPQGPLITNDPSAAYLLADVKSQLSPRRHPYQSAEPTSDLADLAMAVAHNGPASLLWLAASEEDFLYAPDELAQLFRVEVIRQFEDGALYRVWPKPPDTAS